MRTSNVEMKKGLISKFEVRSSKFDVGLQFLRGELLTVFLFAVLLRVAVFIAALHFGQLSISKYTSKGDTTSYLANAAAMCGERPLSSLDEYDLRVFPGYPALIAIVHRLGLSLTMAALCVTWLSAGVAAAAAGRVFEDARVGWAMTCLIPHYLINSSLGMSEAPLLAAVCLALLAWKTDRMILAGILFGFAGMIRPMACFALAGVLFSMLVDLRRSTAVLRFPSARVWPQPKEFTTETRRHGEEKKMEPPMHTDSHRSFKEKKTRSTVLICVHLCESVVSNLLFSVSPCLRGKNSCQENQKSRAINEEPVSSAPDPALGGTSEPASTAKNHRILTLLAVVALTFGVEVLAFQLWTGDALRGIHVYSQNPAAYSGHLFAWPFQSLLTTPAIDGASMGRIAYTWIHVAVTLLACAMVANRVVLAEEIDRRDSIALPWLIGNTAFVLCIGSVWGFRHFPRFTIPAAPAMFWTLRKVLPRNVWWWGLIAAACGVMAVGGVIDSP